VLKKYKLQLMGQLAIATEQKEIMALSMGKSYLRYGKVDELETIRLQIEAITVEQLQAIANEVFDPEKLSVLRYV